jgi:selenide,water dikinase
LLILGGHSIDDPEPKYGLVAVGEAHPARLLTNRGARPGDRLVLTKPIGTGILATALKQDLLPEEGMAEAIGWMTTLNASGMEAALALEGAVHACTDVTGFGLLGHLRNMLEGSGVAARVNAGAVPLLSGARDLAARGAVPGGTARNLDAANGWATWAPGVSEPIRILLCDAQTSGGLLLAVAAADEAALHRELALRGITGWTVGEIVAGAGTVEVT